MGRRSPMLFMALAVVLAAMAAWGANKWISLEADKRAASQIVTAPVLIVKTNLAAGQKLEPSHVTTAAWPRDRLPAGRIKSIKELTGRVTASPMYAGEVVIAERLARQGSLAGLSAVVPSGFRAVTIRVDEAIGVGGFVKPGDRVDVLVTIDAADYRNNPRTITVLQDVPVLTVGDKILEPETGRITALDRTVDIDASTDDKPTGGSRAKPVKVKVVTLQVSPKQGEKLALASTTGELLLSLRNKADSNDTITVEGRSIPRDQQHTPGISLTKLLTSPKPEVKAEPKPVPEPKQPTATRQPKRIQVEVIKGVVVGSQKL